MICRNCSFILQGSEKFCPNCGADCSAKIKTEKVEEARPPAPPEIFFSAPKEQVAEPEFQQKIFREDPDDEDAEKTKPKKSKAKAVLVTLLIAVILSVGGITAMEYLNIAPVIIQYLETGSAEPKNETDETTMAQQVQAEYSSDKGLISPDISYKPTLCYVTSDTSLPLRKGPDDSFAPVAYLPSGSQVQVIGSSAAYEAWVYAFFPSEEKYGWISASFLCNAELPEAEAEESTAVGDIENDDK